MANEQGDLFGPAQPNGEIGDLFGPDISNMFAPVYPPRIEASIARITAATVDWPQGRYGGINLQPYVQQEGTTCFFSGPIAVARDLLHRSVDEHVLAAEARRLGLLDNPGVGAETTDPDKRLALEALIARRTGVNIRFHDESWGEAEEDLEILRVITERKNAALVLAPVTPYKHDWETFFGVTKVAGEEGVRFFSNFSGTSQREAIRYRMTPQMAHLLYGQPHRPYLLICEIQVETRLPRRDLFGPAR